MAFTPLSEREMRELFRDDRRFAIFRSRQEILEQLETIIQPNDTKAASGPVKDFKAQFGDVPNSEYRKYFKDMYGANSGSYAAYGISVKRLPNKSGPKPLSYQAFYNDEIVNKIIVPRVESLIDISVADLTQLVEEYKKHAITDAYYYRTTLKSGQTEIEFKGGPNSNSEAGRTTLTRQKVSESFSAQTPNKESELKIKIGGLTQFVKQRTLDRSHWDGTGFTQIDEVGFITVRAAGETGGLTPDVSVEPPPPTNSITAYSGGFGSLKSPIGSIFVSGSDLRFVGQAVKDNILTSIAAKEAARDGLTSEEMARIIMVLLAIKILFFEARTFKENLLGLTREEKAQLILQRSSLLDTIKREVNENPDFEQLSESEKEALREQVRRGLKVKPQCILISNIQNLAKLNRLRLNAAKSDTQSDQIINYDYTRLVSNPPNAAVTLNKLTKKDSDSNLLNLRPHQIASLFPYLKIYKVITNTKNGKTEEVEFKFPNFYNVSGRNPKMDILGEINNKYTQEYGVKSFNWKFVGSDPFTYSNDIEATLVLFFNDFEQFTVEREDKNKRKYRLLDLLTISKEELKKLKDKDPDARFDIRVDVGWTGPAPGDLSGYDVDDSIRTLFLTMTDYDIGFKQEGHFELTINYKSRLEQSLYDKKTNILQPTRSAQSQINLLEKQLKEQKSVEDASVEKVRELESRIGDLKLSSKEDAYSNIMKFLLKNKSIYSQILSREDYMQQSTNIVSLARQPSPTANPFQGLLDEISSIKNRTDDEEVTEEDKFTPTVKGKEFVLNYFFLGDLVEALAQECLSATGKNRDPSEQQFLDDTRVILTDFLLYDPKDLTNKNVLSLNMGDIPISVDLFMSFYYEKVVKFNVSSYSLMKFIRDLITYCIINVFEDCFGEENLDVTIKTGFLDFRKETRPPLVGSDPFEFLAKDTNEDQNLKLGNFDLGEKYDFENNTASSIAKSYLDLSYGMIPKIASKNERKNCIHALLITSESFDKKKLKIDPNNYSLSRKEDNKQGLYHLDIGSARGILKKINFQKTDQKYLREQRFTQENASSFAILSNVFDVDIDLVGNTLFFPGQRIFINLGERFSALQKSYDPGFTFSKIMGLGGYHLITSVENEISINGFNTKINARWETSGDGETKDPTTGVSTTAGYSDNSEPEQEPLVIVDSVDYTTSEND